MKTFKTFVEAEVTDIEQHLKAIIDDDITQRKS